MMTPLFFLSIVVVVLLIVAYFSGSLKVKKTSETYHSTPSYCGAYVAVWLLWPVATVLLLAGLLQCAGVFINQGLAIVESKETRENVALENFQSKHLAQAILATRLKDGQVVENKTVHWDGIDDKLPHRQITIYGPPKGTAKYRFFIKKVVKPYARKKGLQVALREEVYEGFQKGDMAELREKLDKKHSEPIALVPYQIASRNIDTVSFVELNGVKGTKDAVRSGDYALSKRLGERMLDPRLIGATLIALCLIGLLLGIQRVQPDLHAYHFVEKFIFAVLIAASAVSILTTVGIVLSIVFEALTFFKELPNLEAEGMGTQNFWTFLTGTEWAPESDKFGSVPLFCGTFVITFVAMLLALPVGLLSAIAMSEYASLPIRRVAKPTLEILAGIPTVVYGFFAAITVSPIVYSVSRSLRDFFYKWQFGTIEKAEQVQGMLEEASGAVDVDMLGRIALSLGAFFDADTTNALAPGVVMGIMIIPLISSLCDDVITAVPQSLRAGSYALGATESETIKKVVLPAALPGIVSAILLAVSRAVGETMIVVMAAGLKPTLSINPLKGMTTVTVRIVAALTGDQSMHSMETLSAFALGLVLLAFTLILNIFSSIIIRKFKKQYE
jgi:phosphate transport system permease protein